MTDCQKKFAQEYVKCGNATQAYKSAYPKVKKDQTAASAGARLRNDNKEVKEYIDKMMAELARETVAEAGEVLEYLTAVLRGESEAEIVVTEGIGDGCSEARKLQKRPDEKERLRAAELLGRRYGLFNDKLDVKSEARVVIIDDLGG